MLTTCSFLKQKHAGSRLKSCARNVENVFTKDQQDHADYTHFVFFNSFAKIILF